MFRVPRGIYDAFGGEYPYRTHFNHETKGHFNHWHVDWIPPGMLAVGRPAPVSSRFKASWQRSCPNRQKEARPLRKRRQLQRPMYVGGPQISAASTGEINQVLGDEGLNADDPGFQLPLGDIDDFGVIQAWLAKFVLVSRRHGRAIH